MDVTPDVPRAPDERELTGDALVAALERRFRTTVTPVRIAGLDLTLLQPANADDLISEDDFVRDERLPYWADLWPSSIILAARLAREGGGGRRLLELGCGSGLVSTVAVLGGFDVMATDYYEDALLFTRANGWRNAAREPRTRHVDWRHFPADLGRYEVVVASDVLYEREYGPLVAEAFARSLAPGGRGLVADPGRLAVGEFVDACARRKLNIFTEERVPYESGKIRQTIDIYRVTRMED